MNLTTKLDLRERLETQLDLFLEAKRTWPKEEVDELALRLLAELPFFFQERETHREVREVREVQEVQEACEFLGLPTEEQKTPETVPSLGEIVRKEQEREELDFDKECEAGSRTEIPWQINRTLAFAMTEALGREELDEFLAFAQLVRKFQDI